MNSWATVSCMLTESSVICINTANRMLAYKLQTTARRWQQQSHDDYNHPYVSTMLSLKTLVNTTFVTSKLFSVSDIIFSLNSNMFLVFIYHARFLRDIQL
jgi:hypothetical protein